MLLLLDIGNTNTHLGLASGSRIVKQANIPTAAWGQNKAKQLLGRFISRKPLEGAAFCSVVPAATRFVKEALAGLKLNALELNHRTLSGVGIDYSKPETIGPDRLANAVAVRHHFGAPAVVVDFGTAVTFDVVNATGDYVGGIIAPGLAVMTEYLHEKTALLPRIKIREITTAIGKSTEEAMLVGAVHGYRGLIRALLAELKRQLGARKFPVVATGGYADLIAAKLPEINAVRPLLTLEGVRLEWEARRKKVRR
jgi:type III pantothenate kinase